MSSCVPSLCCHTQSTPSPLVQTCLHMQAQTKKSALLRDACVLAWPPVTHAWNSSLTLVLPFRCTQHANARIDLFCAPKGHDSDQRRMIVPGGPCPTACTFSRPRPPSPRPRPPSPRPRPPRPPPSPPPPGLDVPQRLHCPLQAWHKLNLSMSMFISAGADMLIDAKWHTRSTCISRSSSVAACTIPGAVSRCPTCCACMQQPTKSYEHTVPCGEATRQT